MEPRLPKDLISQPELWRCLLHITPTRLNVALVPPVVSEELVGVSLPLNPDAPTGLKAIEDAVYDNPLLLSDFRSVECLVETPAFAVLPAELLTPGTAPALLARVTGLDEMPGRADASASFGGAVILYEVPEALEAFLRRTFFGVKISHPLEAIGRAATAMSEADNETVMLVVADSATALTVAAAKEGRLLMLNSFAVSHPTDAAYYLLASRSTLGLNRRDGRTIFAGQAPLARTVANIAGPYLDNAGQATLPPDLCAYGRRTASLTFPLLQKLPRQ